MRRAYFKEVDGKKTRVPGVTTVIKQAGWSTGGLLYWANQAGLDGLTLDEARDEATSVGTHVHELIECEIKGRVPRFETEWLSPQQTIQANTAMNAWHEWKQQVDFEVADTEVEVVSESWDVGGRIDLVARVQGDLSVVDWKTSKALYPDNLLQVAAYASIYNESALEPVKRCCIIRLGKHDGGFNYHSWPLESLGYAVDAFEFCLGLYRAQKVLGKML